MPKRQTITERSRKVDILEAYEQLKKELEALKQGPAGAGERVEPESVKKTTSDQKVAIEAKEVEAAYAPEGLIRGISSLKVTISSALGELEDRLVEESRKLESIRKEFGEGRRLLEEGYGSELEAECGAELGGRQAAAGDRWEKEMAEARAEWEREEKARDERLKKEEAEIRRKREWEQDEYEYLSKVKKQRDEETLEAELARKRAEFEEKMREKEQVVVERGTAIKEREEELVRLKREVEQFPKTIEAKIKEAEKEATRATEERFKMEKFTTEREMARLKELNELTVKGLQEKIKEQSIRIQNLDRDLKEAQSQTHQVATRAVEAVARIPFKPVRVEEREEEG